LNPFAHTRAVMRLVHGQLVHWTRDLLLDAGVEGAGVFPSFQDERTAGDHLVVMAYKMGPWPKLVESDRPVNLVVRTEDRSAGVPRLWAAMGQSLRAAVDQLFDPLGAPGGRALPAVPLAQMPPPLAAWYAAQPEDPEAGWTLRSGDALFGRLPSLVWNRPLTVRTYYLIMASDAAARAGDPLDSFAVPALGVITVGLQLRRSFDVTLPAMDPGPELAGYLGAISAAVGGDLGARLIELRDELATPQVHRVNIMPVPDLPSDDFATVMRSLNRPLQPAVHVAVQLGIGGGPSFGAGAAPQMVQSFG
jgi:hypothetical protein